MTTSSENTSEMARLTVDTVLLGREDGRLYVLLIKRCWPPYKGCWALPGGHVDAGEETIDAARRELLEETSVEADRLDLVGVYSAPNRDPRGRYVTFAYGARLDRLPLPVAGDDARDACWWPIADVLARPDYLAFDHAQIIADAVENAV